MHKVIIAFSTCTPSPTIHTDHNHSCLQHPNVSAMLFFFLVHSQMGLLIFVLSFGQHTKYLNPFMNHIEFNGRSQVDATFITFITFRMTMTNVYECTWHLFVHLFGGVLLWPKRLSTPSISDKWQPKKKTQVFSYISHVYVRLFAIQWYIMQMWRFETWEPLSLLMRIRITFFPSIWLLHLLLLFFYCRMTIRHFCVLVRDATRRHQSGKCV